jgi:hypothetical protein
MLRLAPHAKDTVREQPPAPGACSFGSAEHAVYTDTMIETWLAILGLLLFGGWIWWITTGHYRHWPTSSEPPRPEIKMVLWIGYAATAVFVLANSSCEGPEQVGRTVPVFDNSIIAYSKSP